MTNQKNGRTRTQLRVRGIVQGVGFRPFVYRLASELQLGGAVSNDSEGVLIEIEGDSEAVDQFHTRLRAESPPLSRIISVETHHLPAQGQSRFEISFSREGAKAATLISPDIGMCEDCRRELFSESDRRFRYPFINCTNCGPRFSIIEGLPYDRPSTSMRLFPMCVSCEAEYHDPSNRRFHAQPNACWVCGPKTSLWDREKELAAGDVVTSAAELLRAGKVLAIRGLGGFHLAVDATNGNAVDELRRRKHRNGKPFALMACSIEVIRSYANIGDEEIALLQSPRAPIVLLKKNVEPALPRSVAEGSPYLGFMLPCTPFQHLLMAEFTTPLIMTSGNLSEEPIAIGNDEARERLAELADYFVYHDREILQRCDDSIAIHSPSGPQVVRRARGYAPEPILLSKPVAQPILAVAGELKSCVALAKDNLAFLSQHIGDLESPSAFAFFEHAIEHLQKLLGVEPQLIVCDLHPDYHSTRWAQHQNLPVIQAQHHHAHMVSVLAEHGVYDSAVGIVLDGSGYGTDHTIWGGEILFGDASGFERKAHLRQFRLPGGEIAIRQPWRIGISLLRESFGESWQTLDIDLVRRLSKSERSNFDTLLTTGLNSPLTSSCGRLFDGVAAILGFDRAISFEAEAAIWLESISRDHRSEPTEMSMELPGTALDWRPVVRRIVEAKVSSEPVDQIGFLFHVSLAEGMSAAAIKICRDANRNVVALSGGVFQNMLLLGLMKSNLAKQGIDVLTHRDVPTNDGGIALGQILIGDTWLKKSMTKN